MQALTAEELTRLLDSTQDDRLHALWVVLGTTGLRIGEALGLGWVDVQLDDHRLFVRRGLQRVVAVTTSSSSRRRSPAGGW
jgi:integrase